MISAPVYESHKRGKNWMAIITPDPTAPGGLARTFVPRGRGEYYIYRLDRPRRPARRVRRGLFFDRGQALPQALVRVVRALTGEEIRIEHYETAAQAIAATHTGPDRQALEEERSALLARLAEINALLGGGSGLRVTGSGGATRPARGPRPRPPLSPLGEEIENEIRNDNQERRAGDQGPAQL